MVQVTPSAELARLLQDERFANARRVNSIRLWGISFFFALFLFLGVVLGDPSWRGNLREFGIYWIATVMLYLVSRQVPAINRLSGLSIALLDVPMVFVLQWTQFPTAPNPGAIAGYNLGIYVLLLLLSALSLENRVVYATAASAAIFEGLLQHLAGISPGAIVATFIVMSLAAAATAYGSRRLVRLISVLAVDMAARREAERLVEVSRTELAGVNREMEIASRIQTTILPRVLAVPGFEIAAWMQPAEQVGGDYYDIRPMPNGCWLGIGDVTGHGVTAGLVMMMVQTAIASLTTADDERGPAHVIERLNRVMYDNIRNRLGTKDHVTCSLLRLADSGNVQVAGLHEPMIVWRAGTKQCEVIETMGTWIGLAREIGKATTVMSHELAPGDVLVLHTDGFVEAANASNERFGLDRLSRAIEVRAPDNAAALLAHLQHELHAWRARVDDDVTLVVARYTGSG